MKFIVRPMIKLMPYKSFFIKAFAKFPPLFKSRSFVRLCGLLHNREKTVAELETNLGMTTTFRVKLPTMVNDTILFGKPMRYVGERGPLYLSLALAKLCDVFLDVGANIGYFTYFLRANGNGIPVHYFEPNPELFSLIQKNVSCYNFANIFGHQVAIGNVIGKTKFYLDLTDSSSSSISTYFARKHKTEEIEVEVITMKRFVENNNLSNICAKVDIENAEEQFWEGASGVVDKISYLIMEVLGPAVQMGFIKKLISHGLNAYYINDFSLEHSTDGSFKYEPPQYNWLFCRKSPLELKNILKGTKFVVKETLDS